MSVSDLARHRTDRVVIEAYPEPGFNYRMTDMQAALGLCQIECARRRAGAPARVGRTLHAAIGELPHLEAPYEPPYAWRTWQSYCVRVAPVRR